jgi:hypothetical protein
LYGLSALVFAVSAVHAVPPYAIYIAPRPSAAPDEVGLPGGATPLTGSFTSIYCTGFEAPEWDLGFSICGDEFATCVGNVNVGNVCNPKDHLGNGNCCDKDPNEETGWMMNGLARHCNQPHIDNVHPSLLKDPSSLQHLRMQYDPAGGSPVGCTGFGGGCRQRWDSPWDRNQAEVNKTTYKYDIAFSHDAIGTQTRIRDFFGLVLNGGGIYLGAYIYFNSGGQVYAYHMDSIASPGAASLLGYWTYDAPDYAQVTMELDPCNDTLTYTYVGKPNIFFPNGIGVVSQTLGFAPPYGDAAFCQPSTSPNLSMIDNMVWSQSHFDDGQLIDMDNFCITHTPCPDSCCLKDGSCNETMSDTECLAANGKYYPNVQCSQLGTPGYPPACRVATGSCCDAGPRAGGPGPEGSCTDGRTEAECTGSQLTWNKGASCDGFRTLCRIGHGTCSSDPNCVGDKGPGYCYNLMARGCAVDADCDTAGFCYGGLCTPAAIPGHCEYSSKGFCEDMGQCAAPAPTCIPDPLAGSGAGCCDPVCPTPCAGGEACLVQKQPCNIVPSGADCRFCEGCTAWPSVGCSTLGGSAECPSPAAGFAAGTCVANTLYVCNQDADCPAGISGGICVTPGTSPGGILCTSDAECVIPATVCGPEHTGACCDGEDGSCVNDVLEADCKGGQLAWTKLGNCSTLNPPCVEHTGACCDNNPKAEHCRVTLKGDCVGSKQTWVKYATCLEVPSVCPALTWGACCSLLKGDCYDYATEADCLANDPFLQPRFSLDQTCANIVCDPAMGACCDHDTFGGCTDTIYWDCQGGKLEWQKGESCATKKDCFHEGIPTVSEWGLVVLTLLLLVGAKVYFGRRQSAAA